MTDHRSSEQRLVEAERLVREVLESRKLEESAWEAAAFRWLGEDRVYCGCAEPFWKIWKDGSTYCTRCGNYQRGAPAPGKEHWKNTPHTFCRRDGRRAGACYQCGQPFKAEIHTIEDAT